MSCILMYCKQSPRIVIVYFRSGRSDLCACHCLSRKYSWQEKVNILRVVRQCLVTVGGRRGEGGNLTFFAGVRFAFVVWTQTFVVAMQKWVEQVRHVRTRTCVEAFLFERRWRHMTCDAETGKMKTLKYRQLDLTQKREKSEQINFE